MKFEKEEEEEETEKGDFEKKSVQQNQTKTLKRRRTKNNLSVTQFQSNVKNMISFREKVFKIIHKFAFVFNPSFQVLTKHSK